MAPGTDIYSTVPGLLHNSYKSLTGTSMAAPHVTGVAALVLGVNPKLKGCQVADIILRRRQPDGGKRGYVLRHSLQQ